MAFPSRLTRESSSIDRLHGHPSSQDLLVNIHIATAFKVALSPRRKGPPRLPLNSSTGTFPVTVRPFAWSSALVAAQEQTYYNISSAVLRKMEEHLITGQLPLDPVYQAPGNGEQALKKRMTS
uniref:Uncharacterized protein n=1 Tax=Talaromyces marneffei PM1 TaxID=1077442 RepID=A0A093XV45_TALMA